MIHESYLSEGLVATVSADGGLSIYDLDTMSHVALPRMIRATACCLVPQRDVVVVATGSRLDLLEMITWEVQASVSNESVVHCCLCSPDGMVLYAMTAHDITKWDISQSPQLQQRTTTRVRTTFYADLNAAGTILVVAGQCGDVEVWDTVREEFISYFSVHVNDIYECVLFDNSVYTAGDDGQLCCTDLSTRSTSVVHQTRCSALSCAVSRELYVHLTESSLTVFDKRTNKTVYELSDDKANFIHCAFTPNEQYLVILPMAGPILVWSVAGHLFYMSN